MREVAAYVVSKKLGFHFVPFTTLREDGPHGIGSLQQYIEYKIPKENPTSNVYQRKITPKDSKPTIWRRVLVEDMTTLSKLLTVPQDLSCEHAT